MAEPVPALPFGGTSLPALRATVIVLPAMAIAGLFIDESIIEQPAAASAAASAVAETILRAIMLSSPVVGRLRGAAEATA